MEGYSILHAIGNTPLVRLSHLVPANHAKVYVKLEYFNPTSSYKDRMALAIVEGAERKGRLTKEMTVIECTGGSTGTSLAMVCRAKGYRFKVISSDAFAKEKLQAMQVLGAELELEPSEGGKITPDLVPRMIKRAEGLASQPGYFFAKQFYNEDAFDGYRTLAEELITQLPQPIDVFCGAVGTAGMLIGTAMHLKKINSATKVIALEPASAPLLSRGIKGTHKVDGIAVGFVPPLLNKNFYDGVMEVDESEARAMVKKLAAQEGIFAGTSTGINVVAAIELAKQLGSGHTVVTVACDSGLKYLSSGLFN
ncbi:MAG: Pyridoxal-5'-phosphate-dependent enzyme beta superfamily (fold type II) [Cytophagales bacterium]|jgi:cysteine synthase A|nr:cysteine synthase family protein [Bacteroidota bacterium]MBS1981138.1 cysteine synthase family protein [Bacteroidota bacterium]WHZ06627.1 MAG: Pyridoxal-5'-phosphate-dependent enzyme beta superfamily (fold type II) [Cytophagales bacterium]